LDYLIKTRKEYYVRHHRERTLKKGDRVAVLGHGIAVVDQVDGKEVQVVLGNRLVLRIARKEIVVNEQNNRGKKTPWPEVTKYASRNLCESEHAHWTESGDAAG
jgi:preprotein translocase subunit YajC